MIKTLYKKFQSWSATGSVYIISDPHFEDPDMDWRLDQIKKLTGRTDLTPDFIPIYICREINKVCRKTDTIIILGDIGNEKWIEHLHSNYRILIKGNHDKGTSHYESVYDLESIDPKFRPGFVHKKYTKHLFDEIYEGPLFIAKNIVLSHEPLPPGPYFNIHGHEHKDHSDEWLDFLAGVKISDQYLNTCCEHNNFVPMNLDKIIKEKALGQFTNIHRVIINEATFNSKVRKGEI